MKRLNSASKWLREQKRSHKVGVSVFMVVFAVVGVALLLRSFAAGERIYISPATSSVQTGNDVTVTVRLDAGTGGVSAVDATITYDQAKLTFKSIDGTASGLPDGFIATGGNGKVNIVRGITGTGAKVTGDVEVAKVTFTASSTSTTSAALTLSGEASLAGTNVPVTFGNGTISITGTSTPPTATTSYTIESTVVSPVANVQFGLKVYINSTAVYQGGEVTVNLPSGLAYTGTLDTTGTAFNPATTVAGTGAQTVNLVFVTQSTTMTGKQLVATIPVIGSTLGDKSITFTNARLVDNNNANITPITANPLTVTINSASMAAPVVTIPGKTQIAATENITNLKQTFTITNYDSTATYTVTLAGQNLAVTSGGFAIPAAQQNGDLTLQVGVTKGVASGNASYTIRLRSPNVNRVGCVELLDLLLVNKGYGAASTQLDLNFDNTVSLVDLLTVTTNWGGSCI